MTNYELLYIVPNQYTDEEALAISKRIDGVLTAAGATLGFEENMGKKKLAYPINQVAHGYYFLREFELENGEALAGINNSLRLDKEILRAQILSKKKLTPEQQEKIRVQAEKFERARARNEKTDQPAETKTPAKREEKKIDMKNLDEKLEEILKTDDLV